MPSSYLVIESQDRFEFRDVEEGYRLVAGLASRGIPVTLSLVLNGVLAARQSGG